MGKNKETEIQNQIRMALAESCMIFRANVGGFYTDYGGFISSGLPNGFPDLFGFRKSDGKMVFIEVKTEKGRLRKEQEHFLEVVGRFDVLSGVARSVEEAMEIVNG